MTLLAIDTSTRAMGLSLYDGTQILYESLWHSQNYHTVELAPSIQHALAQASLKQGDLKAIAVAIGPGSYTGLRIGLALAKGLAFAERLPLIPVPTLDVLAAGQPIQDMPLAAVLQAGRSRLAVAWYTVKENDWISTGDPELMTVEELSDAIRKPTLVSGELDEAGLKLLGRKRKNVILSTAAWNLRRPSLLAELAWNRWKDGVGEYQVGLAPKYMKSQQEIPA
jgi:tRNA threonylcarbamoyladenosine biosynthesis protein TsaB